ncbi:11966_t:CDS:1, partial [Diversispora eburnea]
TSLSSSDSEFTSSDWYDLDLKKLQKNYICITKKKVVSPTQKYRKNRFRSKAD